jgi:hypothetical protein
MAEEALIVLCKKVNYQVHRELVQQMVSQQLLLKDVMVKEVLIPLYKKVKVDK